MKPTGLSAMKTVWAISRASQLGLSTPIAGQRVGKRLDGCRTAGFVVARIWRVVRHVCTGYYGHRPFAGVRSNHGAFRPTPNSGYNHPKARYSTRAHFPAFWPETSSRYERPLNHGKCFILVKKAEGKLKEGKTYYQSSQACSNSINTDFRTQAI